MKIVRFVLESCTFRFHYYIQKDFLFKQLVYLALQFLRREVAGDDGPLPINQEMLADVVDGPIADDGAAPIFVVGNQVPFDAVVGDGFQHVVLVFFEQDVYDFQVENIKSLDPLL